MKVTRFVAKSNEEWRHERAKSIGASSIGILLGENHWTTPMELAERMKAELNGHFDYTQNLAMMRGHAYEQGVADLFSWATKKELIKASSAEYIVRRDDLPFMHCSPDRSYWIDPDGPKVGAKGELNKGLVECKTTRKPIDPENPPLAWQYQLQFELGITGYKEGYLAWDVLSQAEGFGYHRYEFSQDVFDIIVKVCQRFWDECIIGDKIPDPTAVRDVINRWPESVEGKIRNVDNDVYDLCVRLAAMKVAIADAKATMEELEGQIKLQFEDDEAISYNGKTLATYKTTAARTTIDGKKLKEKYPQAYAECSKVGNSSRTFRLKDSNL